MHGHIILCIDGSFIINTRNFNSSYGNDEKSDLRRIANYDQRLQWKKLCNIFKILMSQVSSRKKIISSHSFIFKVANYFSEVTSLTALNYE